MQVDLFIRGYKADIGEQHDFVRTFKRTLQFSDLENPTKITTDYTYSCTLPGTSTNKMIFSYIDNGTEPYSFNPAAKYEFILNVNGTLWLKGSVKLDKVTINKGQVTFRVSFFSSIHDKIVELGNLKLTDLTGIAGNNYFNHYLDASSLADFWAGTHSLSHAIRYIPTRAGMYQDFQNSKIMTDGSTDTIPGTIPVRTIDIGDDYDEYSTKEYRVEYQRPAVSTLLLTKFIMQDSGVTVDDSLMTSPLIQNSWMMNPIFNVEAIESDIEGKFNAGASGEISASSSTWVQEGMYQITPSHDTVFNGVHITPEANCRYVVLECIVRMSAKLEKSVSGDAIYMDNNSGESPKPRLTAKLWHTGSDYIDNTLANTEFKLKAYQGHDWLSGDIYLGYPWYIQGNGNAGDWCIYYNKELTNRYPGWSDCYWTPVKMMFLMTPGMQTGKNYALHFTADRLIRSYNNTAGYNNWLMGGTSGTASSIKFDVRPITDLSDGDLTRVKSAGFQGKTLYYALGEDSWSPLYANMNKILDSSMSQRDFLTDISKMTGCIWDIQGDSISIKTRNNFFSDYEIKDWTEKLDRSSDIELKPLTYDKATYTMSYKDGDSFLEHQFKDKTGMDYGKQYIKTGYSFNNDEESLLECASYNTVMSKGDRKCVILNDGRSPKIQTQTPYEIPMIETKDNGSPKEGPRFVFDCGVTYLEKGEFVYTSHDSAYMRADEIGGKCWMDTQHREYIPEVQANTAMCNAIPKFGTRLGMATFDFAKPSISFNGENDTTYPDNISLYQRFWSKYLEDLYSAKTRVMTAWFWLSPTDLLTFNFKDFVIIDNKLWHPNKIIDFDISGESLTKVELVEVQNIDAWVNGQDWDFDIDMESGYYNYTDSSSMVIYPPVVQNDKP